MLWICPYFCITLLSVFSKKTGKAEALLDAVSSSSAGLDTGTAIAARRSAIEVHVIQPGRSALF